MAAQPHASSDHHPSSLTIRPVTPADIPDVWQLLRALAQYEKLTHLLTGSESMLAEALFGQGARLCGLVAQVGATPDAPLVGYALFYPVFSSFRARWRLWLEDIYVTPTARGLGAGAAMMAELARIARDEGYIAIDWEVLDWNRPALDFYNHLGARPIAADWLRYRLEGHALDQLGRRTPHGDATQP